MRPPDDPHKVVEAPVIVIPPAADTMAAAAIAAAPRVADPLSPTTTVEEDRKTEGQRQINMIWETTQMKIAISVIWSALGVSGLLAVMGKWLGTPDMQLAAIVFLFGVANLVTGFYFGRTNHQRSGGVGGDAAGTR